jgi:hypothetical protein
VGLPDIYGSSGTLFTLSLMDYSWPVPAIDFSAYERVRLGWLKPTVVSQSKTGIVLQSANNQLAAIKIPTSRPYEYFLIEHRKKPASGFGSSTAAYDGLEVLHVLDGSQQSYQTPMLKVEPADGVLPAGGAADPNDLLYPGNPVMKVPYEGKTCFGANVVFKLQNVTRPTSTSMKFDVVTGTSALNPPNLVTNSTFELTIARNRGGPLWTGFC